MAAAQGDARERITTAIKGYLGLFRSEPKGEPVPLSQLAIALDRLVMCYHGTPDVEPDTEEGSPAPRSDERSLTEAASRSFPELGWYALVDPLGEVDQQVGLSIADSDLAEVAVDLIEVLWLFENASENDAIWQFRWGYQFHWGRHLHEIRVYLHSLSAW